MQLRKYRWSRTYESAEEELVELLARKNLSAARWTAEDGTPTTDRRFTADSRLWCAEGLLFCTADGKQYSLQPGDVLDIPTDTTVNLRIGLGGCTVYETTA